MLSVYLSLIESPVILLRIYIMLMKGFRKIMSSGKITFRTKVEVIVFLVMQYGIDNID